MVAEVEPVLVPGVTTALTPPFQDKAFDQQSSPRRRHGAKSPPDTETATAAGNAAAVIEAMERSTTADTPHEEEEEEDEDEEEGELAGVVGPQPDELMAEVAAAREALQADQHCPEDDGELDPTTGAAASHTWLSRGPSRADGGAVQGGAGSDGPYASSPSRQPPDGGDKASKKRVLFNYSHGDYDVVATVAEERGWRVIKQEEKAGNSNLHWIDDAKIGDWLCRVEPWMRVNHFPGMNNALARKSRLARNMARMQRIFPKEYTFIPPTWVLPDDIADLERRFQGQGAAASQGAGAASGSEAPRVIYIVKPDHLCQGRGIFLTTDVERLRRCAVEGREKDTAIVVQRYITRPMLIDGYKFDLRLYFLVCARFGEGGGLEPRYFLFRDGLVRMCTTPYEPPTPDTFDQRCMHLTNYAINKNSSDFQQPNDGDDGSGHKRSLRWFLSYVEETFGERERRKLWQKLMALCVKMQLTVHPTIEAEYSGVFPRDLTGGQMGCRCFEVLGVDVMLDAKRKPYLIEVNHLPSFTTDSPLDEDIKHRLLEQTLDLTCATLSPKDKRTYDQLVRERREVAADLRPATGGPEGAPKPTVDCSILLEQTSYKDFERAYPPPATSPKLAAQCVAILSRVREVFRPVAQARRPRRDSGSSAEKVPVPGPSKPPLPPRAPYPSGAAAAAAATGSAAASSASGAGATAGGAAAPTAPAAASGTTGSTGDGSAARRAGSSAPATGPTRGAASGAGGSSTGGAAPPAQRKRSRSAPVAPRCALPPIARFASPRLARQHVTSPPPRAGDGSPSKQLGTTRSASRQRSGVFLQVKSAQILL